MPHIVLSDNSFTVELNISLTAEISVIPSVEKVSFLFLIRFQAVEHLLGSLTT